MSKYTITNRATRENTETDDPKVAYQAACRIEEQDHRYAIRDNEAGEYVTRLSVYLRY